MLNKIPTWVLATIIYGVGGFAIFALLFWT